jgi:sec-independent protein translocase protein TatC
MSDDSELPTPQPVEPATSSEAEVFDDEGGGPVKSFLEHLEDLRWTLIRCAISIALGVVACLTAGNFIISLLETPLVWAKRASTDIEPVVVISLGTNVLSRQPLRLFPIPGASSNNVFLRVAATNVGGANVMALVTDTNPPPTASYSMQVALKTYSPGGGFTIAIQLALFGGLTLSAPFVLFFLGQFILPALHVHEKKFLYRIAGFASLLFFAGIAFCYFVLLPITLSTTAAFSNWLGFGADEWRADEYISFCCWFLLGMGVSFQLPMVLLTLVKIDLLNVRTLSKYRAYFYVAILVVAGFVTPDGNPFTMMIMAAPLMFLYEVSVVIAWFWARADRKAALENGDEI